MSTYWQERYTAVLWAFITIRLLRDSGGKSGTVWGIKAMWPQYVTWHEDTGVYILTRKRNWCLQHDKKDTGVLSDLLRLVSYITRAHNILMALWAVMKFRVAIQNENVSKASVSD